LNRRCDGSYDRNGRWGRSRSITGADVITGRE
jgi:hypothetical protein